jgi:hypothetical protein
MTRTPTVTVLGFGQAVAETVAVGFAQRIGEAQVGALERDVGLGLAA